MELPKTCRWYSIHYGFDRILVYAFVSDDAVFWCSPRWCVSSMRCDSVKRWESYNPVFAGYGKRKWWWRFALFLRDVLVPYTLSIKED